MKAVVHYIQLMRWNNRSRDNKNATTPPAFFRRVVTPDPVLSDGKCTLQTHQTTAEDDLLSITNDIFPSTPNPEIDIHQITAWNSHAKHGPFRVRSPLKQVAQAPILTPKQTLSSQLGGSSELRDELKAKLRQYEVARSASFFQEPSQQTSGKCFDDYWNEVEGLNLDKMTINAVREQRAPKKTMIMQPFFTLAIKRNIKAQKRTKSTSSHHSSHGPITHRNSSSPKGTIAHTTELRFPSISEEAKLQARLSLYRRQTPVSK